MGVLSKAIDAFYASVRGGVFTEFKAPYQLIKYKSPSGKLFYKAKDTYAWHNENGEFYSLC